MSKNYREFLQSKLPADHQYGFEPTFLPDCMKPFQNHLANWSVRKGRCAIWSDCGTGKSIMELVFAQNVVEHTNRPVLLVTPLAVGAQMVREGKKFGIPCKQTRDGTVHKGINVTNFERLHYLNADDFSLVIVDEAGAIKNADSKTRRIVTNFLEKVNYRLLCTATPAPNDYVELGTSSEAVGAMGRNQMLGMFFTYGQEDGTDWVLKGHAKSRFWQWISTWARGVRRPSDLGFSDDGYILPKLNVNKHVVKGGSKGMGFGFTGAKTLEGQRKERKATIKERCELVASLLPKDDYSVVWCGLNDEGDMLQKIIPGSVQISGNDKEDVKESRLIGFANGDYRVLITKPKIGCFGLNWQHCNHMTYFPNFSYEQWYQAIRRCWRFGQSREVTVDIVTCRGESRVIEGMRRKENAASKMFADLVAAMREYQNRGIEIPADLQKAKLPSWLR